MNLQSRCKVKEMEFDERWSLPKMASRISDTVELIRYKQYIYISLLLSIKNCIYRLPQKKPINIHKQVNEGRMPDISDGFNIHSAITRRVSYLGHVKISVLECQQIILFLLGFPSLLLFLCHTARVFLDFPIPT